MKILPSRTRLPALFRQLSMTLDSHRLDGMSPSQRETAILRLAKLVMAAAGAEIEETTDDWR